MSTATIYAAPDPRYKEISDAVRVLSPLDDRCLLAFLLGYKSCDEQFLTVIEEWLESNRSMNARIAERLNPFPRPASQPR